MKQIKCKSGITGWQCRLQESYASFQEFELYDFTYNITERLGYPPFISRISIWEENPIIQGSVEPSDLCLLSSRIKCEVIQKLRNGENLLLWDKKNRLKIKIQRNAKEKFICWERFVCKVGGPWIKQNTHLSLKSVCEIKINIAEQYN